MKYLSTFSGIEAATVAWHPLGWEPVGFSEIEPFPCAVLKHHYPQTPNYGDITQFRTWTVEPFDVLVGGSPCQSFSVAGLRKGLEDPRGNLMLTFLAVANHFKPKYITWENVPGVLSSNNGKDFQSFLDGMESIGYICDVEILDAQYFGLAQRRKRVFVCGQNVEYLRSKKTALSSLTMAKCLLEILHGIWADLISPLEREPALLEQASLSRDGAMRRMKLFGILTENCCFEIWRQNLVETFLKHQPEQKNWDLPHGGKTERELTLVDLLMGSKRENQYTLTEQLLSKTLEDVYEVMKLYTISTLTSETIQSKTYLFFQTGEVIGRLICHLSGLSPNSLSAVSSFLTYQLELTHYARQASRNLFSTMEWHDSIIHFVEQAIHTDKVVGHFRNGVAAAAVLFDPHSLSGHPPPSREKRQGTTGGVTAGSHWSGGPHPSLSQSSNIGGIGMSNQEIFSQGGAGLVQPMAYDRYNDSLHEIAPTVQAANTGRVNGVVQPIAFGVGESSDVGHCIRANSSKADKHDSTTYVAQPFQQIADCLTAGYGTKWNGNASATNGSLFAAHQMAVRRLTPTECERLQGFPDGYTAIPWKNKPADQCPDGPRYKALGNSMAVPVMRWIGERIQAVEDMMKELKK